MINKERCPHCKKRLAPLTDTERILQLEEKVEELSIQIAILEAQLQQQYTYTPPYYTRTAPGEYPKIIWEWKYATDADGYTDGSS